MKHEKISNKYKELFGENFSIYRAPGRINLLGEHTDYNDGFVLPAAIDKEIVFAVGKNNSKSKCNLYAVNLSEQFSFEINNMKPVDLGWPNYIMGVVSEIVKQGGVIGGFNMVFEGDIPLGAGLSSSAALESGSAIAIIDLFTLRFDKISIIKIAQLAEHNFAGVNCGIMDQFASVMGKKDSAFKLDCQSLEYNYFPLKLNEYQLILCDTKVKHSLAVSEYNNRILECEQGVVIIKRNYTNIENLRDVSMELLDLYKDAMSNTVYNRCSYVIEENARVEKATSALLDGNIKLLGELMYETHNGLSHKYEVSCNELDYLVDITKNIEYVAGARMMGGGFGGCTLNLVKRRNLIDFKQIMLTKYKSKFDNEAEIYEVEITDGAEKVS